VEPANLLTAAVAARRIAAGELSSEQLVHDCLERITERDGDVGAWEHLDPTAALAQARARDRTPPHGPLHGVPVGVKDIIDTADMPTGYGSPIWRGHRPARDAACVALVREAGGVVLGKTVTTELAYFSPGRTANPHDLGRTPGGSSSGSAAAVADHMVPVALGTQTAGSIIRPAAFCGVVGYKPSFGTISRSGVMAFAESLDTVGSLAGSVADAALLVSVAARRPDLLLRAGPGQAPRVAVYRSAAWDQVSAGSQAALDGAARRLAEAGADISDAALPGWFAELAEAQATVMAFEAARSFAPERREHGDRLSPQLRALLDEGADRAPADYLDALGLAQAGRQELAALFGRHDLILTLSAPGEAPTGLDSTGDPRFNRTWTLLGTPCVHLPTGSGEAGLPVGVQLVGRPGDDARLLASAAWVERQLA
jgi:Asp-tRNA(Asn)/Glu-tRNA(Gln) amidotransferase A subunit family amidase